MKYQLHSRPFIKNISIKHIPKKTYVKSYPFETESYFIGKSITIFVMTYCTLNWFFYQKERKDLEDFYKSKPKETKPKNKNEPKE